MLSVAYSASAGGIATLIGTPPNLILAGFIEDNLQASFFFPVVKNWITHLY